ncbi:alpha/beta hydrolase [Temperatibacter marinus]|uniref:Alpha/beta hydrolase n=1 Tax=Temperatibacter marinus TaxID=1456591 RepID=A0AA52HBB9_9PROT|nr:alpha/beta hydrolase [Temperatibacter marinus]WND03605.1 alpha/beta hydrolase [Temperatibacter marinus]
MVVSWAYKTIGAEQQGIPIIWLHGWGQDHHSLLKIASSLDHQGPHYLFDQPGFGETERLMKGAGTAVYATMLKEQLEALEIEGPVILVGHSFGCRVSVQMAHLFPEWVAGVVMIAGAGLKRRRSPLWLLKSWTLKLKGKIAHLQDFMFKTNKRDEFRRRYGSVDYKNAGELRETFVKVVNENLADRARSIACPTLLLYGQFDTETPPSMGQKYARLIPHSNYIELSSLGHLDVLDRGAYQVKAYLDDFLKGYDT